MVKDFYTANNMSQIKRIIKILGEFATSQNSNVRRGGLLALASVAIALGKVILDLELWNKNVS